jgi:alkanesulfonate monooxygenase SsuD/methylene tetrahydromethanopterin reductase-like flavin-dependent oxidoreductase (luciferase family)
MLEYLGKLAPRNLAGVQRDTGLGLLPTTFVGGPDAVVEQVRRCREEVGAGVIDFSFQNPWPDDRDGVLRALDLFGEKVLPRIRDV